MDIPLNGRQVTELVGKTIGCCSFPQLSYMYFRDLMVNDMLLINYLKKPRFGHWCCLIKIENCVYYFNPSGRFIDECIDIDDNEKQQIYDQDFPHLLEQLYKSPFKIYYCDVKMQANKTNTCGRWCALFLKTMPILYKYFRKPEEAFTKIFKIDDNITDGNERAKILNKNLEFFQPNSNLV